MNVIAANSARDRNVYDDIASLVRARLQVVHPTGPAARRVAMERNVMRKYKTGYRWRRVTARDCGKDIGKLCWNTNIT